MSQDLKLEILAVGGVWAGWSMRYGLVKIKKLNSRENFRFGAAWRNFGSKHNFGAGWRWIP